MRVEKLEKSIGRVVRTIRKEHGFCQTRLAKIIGVDQSAFSRIENGKQSVTLAQWVRICMFLGVNDHATQRVLETT